MKLYSRYIFNQTTLSFVAFASILVCLIWFSRAISFVKYVTENGVALSQFFYLFILILPWLLLFIIPVSLFAAILLIYNRLIANNELAILKNSGLTKAAICRPLFMIIGLCSVFCFLLSFYLMPYANKQLRLSRANLKNNYASLAFNPQTFETLNNITIYTKDRDKNNNLHGILLHDQRSSSHSMTITAQRGNITTENNSVLLYMENGTVQKLNYESDESEILTFDNYVFNLTETQEASKRARWKAKERYLHELINPQGDQKPEWLQQYRAEIHQRFTYPLLSAIFALIALSFILSGDFSRKGNTQNIIKAIVTAVIFLGITITSYDLIEKNEQMTFAPYLIFTLSFIIGIKALRENKK